MISHEIINPTTDLEVKLFEFNAENEDRYFPPHWHGSVEVLFCLEGKLNIWLGSVKEHRQLKAGDIILINSNIVHSTQSPCSNHIFVLQIPLSFIQKLTKEEYNVSWMFNLDTLKNQKKNDQSLREILTRLTQIFKSQELSQQLLTKSELYNLLSLLVSEYRQIISVAPKINKMATQTKMAEIMRYIQEHYKEDISLTHISECFNYSTSYFSKLFKKYVGINFTDYLTSIRLNHAQNLLINSDWSIVDIAIESGFNNTRTFYNAFTHFYKVSPSDYRKNKKDKIFPNR